MLGNTGRNTTTKTPVVTLSPEALLQRRTVAVLGKQLKNNCDKIFDKSIPFVIDIGVLARLCDAIAELRNCVDEEEEEAEDEEGYRDLVMFLSDFCQQTPSLCINSSQSTPLNALQTTKRNNNSDSGYGGGPSSSSGDTPKKAVSSTESSFVDISLFRSLQTLELRNTPPTRLTSLNSLRSNLVKFKCSRNVKSVLQVLCPTGSVSVSGVSASSSTLASIWPELRELDLSYNKVCAIGPQEISVLELCPSLEVLNLSRNRLTGIDDKLSSCLTTLTSLNLSYNQLKGIPSLPPNVKVLLLSHNLIGSLSLSKGACAASDPFNVLNPLRNLEVLDLGTNLISNEADLLVLKDLTALKRLGLAGNPVAFVPDYRRTVCSYLSRYVISRRFELDRKPLSNSEVRNAIQDCKQEKFIPYVPVQQLLVSSANSALSSSISSSSGMGGSTSSPMSTSKEMSASAMMTQSFESNSSSMRSLRRKKPKIREIITMEFPEDRENIASSSSFEGSTSSTTARGSVASSPTTPKPEEETKRTLSHLREKYGPEYWLLRQAGTEVDRILRIPDRPINYDLFSRSLPREFRQPSPPTGKSPKTFHERSLGHHHGERYTNEELLLINSKRGSAPPPQEQQDTIMSPKDDKDPSSSSDLGIYFTAQEEFSIFDLSKDDPLEEVFDEVGKTDVRTFKIFQSGEVLKLVVYDGYLIEMRPEDNVVLNKWDLNCLYALEEERCDGETESVQFSLKFDTMRKAMRERGFIMGSKDFSSFDKTVSPYIEERTMQEFMVGALQCAKCFAQFSKRMAVKTVRMEDRVPREVKLCPSCGNDVLLTLDNIPLPNDECLELDDEQPLYSSTPISAARQSSLSQSIPKGKSPGLFDPLIKLLPSSLTTRFSPPTTPTTTSNTNTTDKGVVVVHAKSKSKSKSSSPSDGSTSANNTKSESDIEVLSTDSSSIEVLARHGGTSAEDSGSDAEVEEGVEIGLVHRRTTTTSISVPALSESTSSSSCADSIVTTYEKNLHVISQPLDSPSRTGGGASFSLANASFASNSTLTSSSSPAHHNTGIPVRYDYVNFAKPDHRLQLWADVTVFTKADEGLLALSKCVILADASSNNCFLGLVIFSNKRVYFYKIIANEGDRPHEWLQKYNSYDLNKFSKLDVLIGRHGVGIDFSGKYYDLVFRDSERTSAFLEFFMSNVCGELKTPPMVRDFSQTQKMMLSPTDPISYFGIMRLVMCDSVDHVYAVSAILLTNVELLLITDLNWMTGRCDKVVTTRGRQLSLLRQVEYFETDPVFLRLMFEVEKNKFYKWELVFETEAERSRFQECLKSDAGGISVEDVPFVCLSQPLES